MSDLVRGGRPCKLCGKPVKRSYRLYCSPKCSNHDRTPKYSRYKQGGLSHVRVAEGALGKRLPKGACVHHVNEDRYDNRPSNLVICQDAAYHNLLHVRARVVRAGGDPDAMRICFDCHAPKPFSAFTKGQYNCRACVHLYYLRRRAMAS